MSVHELAIRLGAYLGRELQVDRTQEMRMVYGLELFLGETIKFICIIILASIFSILPEVLLILAAACSLRLVSGGEHCSAFYRCLIGVILCFLLLGWLVHNLNPMLSTQQVILIAVICFLLAEIIFWKYAPGDTENKPITDAAEKARFKKWSLLMGGLYLLVMLVLSGVTGLRPYILPIAAGMLEQAFTVSPWGYHFLHFVDQALSFRKWGDNNGEIERSYR